jgi:hypothetical protein
MTTTAHGVAAMTPARDGAVTARGSRPPARFPASILLLPIALFCILAYPALRQNSATYDETSFVSAGYTYLTRQDYRLAPGHPPLGKLLCALPLLWNEPVISEDAARAFDRAIVSPDAEYIFGGRVLYEDNDPNRLLVPARLVALALGAMLVALVGWWGLVLFGRLGGIFAAGLAAADPNLLAHATLATTDIAFALFFFAALFFVWHCFRRVHIVSIVAAAGAVGAAFATKHSALMLVPIVLGMGLRRLVDRRPWPCGRTSRTTAARDLPKRGVVLLVLLVFWALATWGSIWAAYGFRYSGTPDPTLRLPVAQWVAHMSDVPRLVRRHDTPTDSNRAAAAPTQQSSPVGRAILLAHEHRLLPEAFLYGLAYQAATTGKHPNAALGLPVWPGEWRWYYPFVFAVKTPGTTLCLVALGIVALIWAAARRRWSHRHHTEALFLLLPPALFMASSIASGFVTAYRHLLPVLPFLYVFAGALPAWLARRTARIVAILVVVGMLVAETLTVRPYYLSFFNVFAGGTQGGLNLLSSDNLDWGQGLVALRDWMAAEHVAEVNLAYFGTADPAAYGVVARPMVGSFHLDIPGAGSIGHTGVAPKLPGYVAISVTSLQSTYLPPEIAAHYAFLRHTQAKALVGGSILIYWVESWGSEA